jgi:nickel transport protein
MKKTIVIIFLFIYVLLMPEAALAHKMMLDAMVNDDGTVLLEAFFPDGAPAKNTKVEVFLPDGSQFVESTTNADGQFIFTPEKEAGVWKAVATGKMGHKTSAEFEIVAGISAEEQTESIKEPEPARRKIAHKEPIPWNRIISGFGFIFGISAFIISLKLKADLKRLKNALTSTRD